MFIACEPFMDSIFDELPSSPCPTKHYNLGMNMYTIAFALSTCVAPNVILDDFARRAMRILVFYFQESSSIAT